MIGVESVITKIVVVLLKKAVAKSAFAAVGKAVEVYSTFEAIYDAVHTLQTTSDCRSLQTYGLNVLADQVSDRVIDKLLDVGGATYEVRRTSGGVFVASNLAPTFQIAPPPKPPRDEKLRRLIAAYNDGERGLTDDLIQAVLLTSERFKMHVHDFTVNGVTLQRRKTYTLDDGVEFAVGNEEEDEEDETQDCGALFCKMLWLAFCNKADLDEEDCDEEDCDEEEEVGKFWDVLRGVTITINGEPFFP